MSRRRLGHTVIAVLAATLAAATATAAVGTSPPADRIAPPVAGSVTLDEGTNMAVAVSGDGSTLVTDLQGFLWTLPASGGQATPHTDVALDPALPDWSPTEDRIVFQSYRDGTYDLFTANPDGTDLTQLTSGPADDREPRFSPDGTKVAFASDRRGSYDIWVRDLATGATTRWTDAPTEEFQPTWAPDGDEVAYVVGDAPAPAEPVVATTIEAVTAGGAPRTVAVDDSGTIYSPSWSPTGDHLAYVVLDAVDFRARLVVDGEVVSGNEDVFGFPVEWTGPDEFIYTANGDIRRRSLSGDVETIDFTATLDFARERYERAPVEDDSTEPRPVRGISAPKLSPDGEQVAFTALGDLWLLTVGDPTPQRLTRTTYLEADPSWSADGDRLVYTSDAAGSPDLYARTMATGEVERLTRRPGAELGAAWSPDGASMAFQDHEGATFVADLESGRSRLVDEARWLPGHPSWAPDSRTLALAAWDPVSDRYREGASKILLVDTARGDSTLVAPAPFRSLSTRGLDGPVWSPDGSRIAYVMESTLWVRPVGPRGLPTGPPVQVNDEVTDAPSWSGDSSTLLYLSNGRLRTVAADGSADPATVPLRLRWTPQRHRGQLLVHAGRLWDGQSRVLRRDVDIVVRGSEIAAVQPHSAAAHRAADRVIDAGQGTVLPGLIDSHIHNELWGTAFGARKGRLYLAYGVTTARSLGDQVYQATESEESYAAGTQIGPRYLATGEAIDGSRVYYDFMRPTLDADQLRDLELSRARAMSYGILKSYVRLPAELNRIVVAAAHAMGVPALSHYLYPGLAYGQDGQSHISATQRLGYSRSQSLGGVSYSDMTRLFGRSRTTVVPTLFDSSSLLAEDASYADDPRATRLMPSWEFALLAEEEAEAASTDQGPIRRLLRLEVQALRGVLANGGLVAAGTDAPLDQVGLSTHLNLRAMVRYGMTPYQALRTATVLAAREMGAADQLGTVQPGRLADLVVVGGNPLRDITRSDDVSWVLKAGRRYTVPALLAPYRTAAGSARSLVADPASAPAAVLARRLPSPVPSSGEHDH